MSKELSGQEGDKQTYQDAANKAEEAAKEKKTLGNYTGQSK